MRSLFALLSKLFFFSSLSDLDLCISYEPSTRIALYDEQERVIKISLLQRQSIVCMFGSSVRLAFSVKAFPVKAEHMVEALGRQMARAYLSMYTCCCGECISRSGLTRPSQAPSLFGFSLNRNRTHMSINKDGVDAFRFSSHNQALSTLCVVFSNLLEDSVSFERQQFSKKIFRLPRIQVDHSSSTHNSCTSHIGIMPSEKGIIRHCNFSPHDSNTELFCNPLCQFVDESEKPFGFTIMAKIRRIQKCREWYHDEAKRQSYIATLSPSASPSCGLSAFLPRLGKKGVDEHHIPNSNVFAMKHGKGNK